MNIFYLDNCPKLSAQYQCDKHVVKMILESAQLLCSAHHLHPYYNISHLYKLTHKNHPCAIWVRQNMDNYSWLSIHAYWLCKEYEHRYNKVHKSFKMVEWLNIHIPKLTTDVINLFTEPPQCMPEECKVINNSVEAYRKYYRDVKQYTITFNYTNREKPLWL